MYTENNYTYMSMYKSLITIFVSYSYISMYTEYNYTYMSMYKSLITRFVSYSYISMYTEYNYTYMSMYKSLITILKRNMKDKWFMIDPIRYRNLKVYKILL